MERKEFIRTTSFWKKYWQNRENLDYWVLPEGIDFDKERPTPKMEHPHRQVIIDKIKQFGVFRSILEVGCGTGGNLYKIKKEFPGADVGGIDWSARSIEECKRILPRAAVLQVGEATDIYISAKGADIILSDMCFIYLDPKDFRKALKEAKRVARIGVIFCEFNEPNWFKRFFIKLLKGYNAYDYTKEMKKMGFYDIKIQKLTTDEWPGTEKEHGLRAVIVART